MTRALLLALTLGTLPLAALAMPAVGDIVGTNPTDATAALEKSGCKVIGFEAEDGKIEAKCSDTGTGARWEVYIDPATGAVTRIKSDS